MLMSILQDLVVANEGEMAKSLISQGVKFAVANLLETAVETGFCNSDHIFISMEWDNENPRSVYVVCGCLFNCICTL